MKLSAKIYLIVLLLIIVALSIMGLGIYSTRNLTKVIHDINMAAGRHSALSDMEKGLAQRVITMKNILISNDESEMQTLIDTGFKNSEAMIAKGLEDYAHYVPADATDEMKGRVPKLKADWGDLVKVTNEAAALSLQNTNAKAARLFAAQSDMWTQVDKDILAILGELKGASDPNLFDEISSVYETRAQFLLYQVMVTKLIAEPDPAKSQAFANEIRNVIAEGVKIFEKTSATLPPKQKAAYDDILKRVKERAMSEYATIEPLALTDTNTQANVLYNTKGLAVQNAFAEYSTHLMDVAAALQRQYEADADRVSTFVLWAMVVGSLVGLVVGAVISFFTISAIKRTLERIIASLSESSRQVDAAAGQINSASQSLAEGATEQAASLEETSSALEQMASMTRQNADNANRTNDTNKQNNKLIGEGSTAVKNMSTAMGEINDSAEKISRIIKTIEDIAFQTNLLALNAAVEAARAGEAGKGFAVVADEVRNLAQRSAQAARDTTELIEGTVNRVRNGTEIAETLDKSFQEIEGGSGEVSRLIADIANATNEQAQGVDQVNTAVAQMDKVTQQNAASAEETASASEELASQVSFLNTLVGDLMVVVEGAKAGARHAGGVAKGGASPRPEAKKEKKAAPRAVPHAGALPAPEKPASGNRVMKPSEIIPLDEDFGDF